MTGSVSARVEQTSSAKPVTVYDVLMDVDRWTTWMPTVSAASWERHGEPETGRTGVRRVRAGLIVSRDIIVDGARPDHHAYTASLPRLWPVRDYRADVRIHDRQSGSLIVYTVSCTPRIPGLRQAIHTRLHSVYTRLAAALAQEAERLGDNGTAGTIDAIET